MVESSNCRNAPVAWSEADQVLPMFTTSGPLPDVAAASNRLSRSDHGTTSTLTLMPVCFSNLSSSGCRMVLSASRLGPWLLAQYVSVLVPPVPEDESFESPQAVNDAAASATAATMARLRFDTVSPSRGCGGMTDRVISCLERCGH